MEGGYKKLSFFKQTEIIHDFTMEFCKKYVDYKSRTKDQMEQAARSGKQNISEGYAQQEWKSKEKLVRVARGSLEELLQDYLDSLRHKNLSLWEKDDPRAKKVRSFVYKIKDYNRYEAYNLYKPYLKNPEDAANAMICLINQTNAMINKKVYWIQKEMPKEDTLSPREKWLEQRRTKESDKRKESENAMREKMRSEGKIFTSRGYMDIQKAKEKGLKEL
jgi:four helix bundle protein